jgi:hypothetical protein
MVFFIKKNLKPQKKHVRIFFKKNSLSLLAISKGKQKKILKKNQIVCSPFHMACKKKSKKKPNSARHFTWHAKKNLKKKPNSMLAILNRGVTHFCKSCAC